MTVTISAFRYVPFSVAGHVKKLRIRWALEEAGVPYEVELIDPPVSAGDPYRQWQPFGQVPAYRDEAVTLFESGAIMLHLAKKSEALAPQDPQGQARVAAGVIAALNSVEPHVENFFLHEFFHANEAWIENFRPTADAMKERCLTSLSNWLGEKEYLENRFTAADLMMTTVLRRLSNWPLAERFLKLSAYRQRCMDRPAFARALDAQLATYCANEPRPA